MQALKFFLKASYTLLMNNRKMLQIRKVSNKAYIILEKFSSVYFIDVFPPHQKRVLKTNNASVSNFFFKDFLNTFDEENKILQV